MNVGMKRQVAEALDLPKEVLLDLPLISITGKEEITVENHKGILAYSDDMIRIGTKAGTIRVGGSKLYLKQLSADALVIGGELSCVEFLT